MYWLFCITWYFVFSVCDYSLQAVQKEREEKLARFLKDFLNQYAKGDRIGFLRHAESEAKRLSDAGKLSWTFPILAFFLMHLQFHCLLWLENSTAYLNISFDWKTQLLEWIYYILLATYTQDKQRKSSERKQYILGCRSWQSGLATKDISGSHRLQQQKVWYISTPIPIISSETTVRCLSVYKHGHLTINGKQIQALFSYCNSKKICAANLKWIEVTLEMMSNLTYSQIKTLWWTRYGNSM